MQRRRRRRLKNIYYATKTWHIIVESCIKQKNMRDLKIES